MAHSLRASHPDAAFPMRIETILERPPATYDVARLTSFLQHETVLLTGAGGSIGRVLAHQLVSLKPKHLILVDFSEFNLFQLERFLRRLNTDVSLSFHLLDVRDTEAVRTLFTAHKPGVVFHAAAYKHVPMMESHPVQAFQNNTLASVQLLHLAEHFGVEQFVFISTDKAVAPESIMGTTKRLTEWYVRAANGRMQTKTVRFGNVFGSLGSVVPLFTEQILEGGPVTVTHPEMERFFMSVDDACSLILQTLLLDHAPVYTLRMDPSVKILWLAERMIEVLSPHRAIDIEYIGIRAGEKLKEQLWTAAETPMPTQHKDILGLESPAIFSRTELDDRIAYLSELATAHKGSLLREALFETDFIAEAR